jgi:hypothetical protein
MTSITSVSASFFASSISSFNSKSSIDALLDEQEAVSATTASVCGAAFSVEISEEALNGETDCTPMALSYSPAEQKVAKKKVEDTYDALFAYLAEIITPYHAEKVAEEEESSEPEAAAEEFTPHAGYSAQFVGNPNSIEDIIANSGPLPQFLAQVEAQKQLDEEHSNALEDIAWRFRNAKDTPDTVRQIDAALDAAGIDNAGILI